MTRKQRRNTARILMAVAFMVLTVQPLRLEANGSSTGQDGVVRLVINEVLARVPSDDPETEEIEGDANGDGVRSFSEDEFVELVNNSDEPLDISGFVLFDNRGAENGFTFPLGTIIPPGEAVVLFGGGDLSMSPLEFGNARALGLVFTTDGSIGSGLSNTADEVVVIDPSRDPVDQEVARFEYDRENPVPQPVFQSFNRNPDVTGPFDNHMQVVGAEGRPFSPGTKVDGSAFVRQIIGLTPGSGPVSGNNQVTIDGAGFGSQITSVTFGGQKAAEVMRVSPLQLVVTVPPASMAGTVDVVVTDQFGSIVAESAYTYEASSGSY